MIYNYQKKIYIFLYRYIKMVNKYYKKNKEKLQKRHVKDIKVFPKKKKKKGE